jgi:hypothetical protein
MPLQKLQFRPGITKELTTLSGKGGWFDCDKVRFRFGFPEKIGGWAALTYTSFLGVCRSLFNWITLRGFNILGVGTNLKFYVEDGGAYYDVTPIRTTTNNQTTFAATAGSAIVTVTDLGASNLQANDFVTFSGARPLDGIVELNAAFDDIKLFSNGSNLIKVGRNEAITAAEYRSKVLADFTSARNPLERRKVLDDLDSVIIHDIARSYDFYDSKEISSGNPKGRVTYFEFTFLESGLKCETSNLGMKKAIAKFIYENGLIQNNQLNEKAVKDFVLIQGTKYSDQKRNSTTIIIVR